MRLQVLMMAQPSTSGVAARLRRASGRVSAAKASRSRIAIGAVWWLIPTDDSDMLNKNSQKLTIVNLLTGQIKRLACCLGLLMGSVGWLAAAPPASYNEQPHREQVAALLQQAAQSRAIGDEESALADLLAAAHIANDLALTQQAVALAWRLNDWMTLAEASRLWWEAQPESDDARRVLALALLNSGQDAAAAELLGSTVLASDDLAAAWVELIQILTSAIDPAVAEAVFERLLGADLTDLHELRARSRFSWHLEQPQRALALALEAVQISGAREDLAWAAHVAASLDDHELALSLYRQARRLASTDPVLALSEAETLRELGRIDEALAVVSAMTPSPDVLYSIALYHHLLGDPDSAHEAWEQMAQWREVEDGTHHAFMVAYMAEILGLREQAAQWYARVRGGPRADRALLRRAMLMAEQDRLEEARQLLVLARDTEQWEVREEAWLIEADLLQAADQTPAAVDLLGQALRESPGRIRLLYARAMLALAIDDLPLAEQDLRSIIQLDGDNAMALNALGYILTDRTSRHTEAYRLIQRALELAPDEPAILDSMGWVYFRLGRPEVALDYLERALEGEDNPEIAAHLGEVLWHLDELERAREVLMGAWERHPEDRHLSATLARLGMRP